jgi:hypothetical protein
VNGHHGGRGGGNSDRPQCQVCCKIGHTTDKCWYCYDEDCMLDPRHNAATTTTSYNVDNNWYTDSGATDHITSELDKLVIREKYNGGEKVHTASGSGTTISHIGKSFIHTPTRKLQLSNILHVPKATKSLMPIHHFSLDNNVFFKIHPWFFFIKDRDTRNTLLKGQCLDGLYPRPTTSQSTKFSFGVDKPYITRWHDRLGHPTFPIVQRVLKEFSLPVQQEVNKDHVCGPCQQTKSHQLPYLSSTSLSSHPLELVFSDVWGPAVDSVGRYKYYGSFLDDYSKFTWIYLLKFKSEVIQKFHEFQFLVERFFNRKIITVQSD